MERISTKEALRRRKGDGKRYPGIDDPRCIDGMMFPIVNPSFTINSTDRIFTIGSCFARNVEAELPDYDVPTTRFSLPDGETLKGTGNAILNEYNPGTMAQRIGRAAEGRNYGDGAIIEEGDGFVDLLLPGGVPVSRERVLERRGEIDSLYSLLPKSDVLIVTLGLVEAWYDLEDELYLNRVPGGAAFRNPDKAKRYELRILDADAAFALLRPALEKAFEAGLKRAIVTVSPVPLQTTFSDADVIVANAYSKATLRCVADKLVSEFDCLDYFPSYEMVTVQSGNPFIADNVHVRPDVVARVIKHMLQYYAPSNKMA